jgi:hypothetical protein
MSKYGNSARLNVLVIYKIGYGNFVTHFSYMPENFEQIEE